MSWFNDSISTISTAISALFGILGTATETKKNGKLTWWGIGAVIGIVITNTFTVIKDRVDKANDAQKATQADSERVAKLELDNNRYRQTAGKLDTAVMFAAINDTASRKILSDVRQVETKDSSLLREQKQLVVQGRTIDSGIIRTLNPLFPFSIDISLRIRFPQKIRTNLEQFQPFYNSCLGFDTAYVDRHGSRPVLLDKVLDPKTRGVIPFLMSSTPPVIVQNGSFIGITRDWPGLKTFPGENLQFFVVLDSDSGSNPKMIYLSAFAAEKLSAKDQNLDYGVSYSPLTDSYTVDFSLQDFQVYDPFGQIRSSLDFLKYSLHFQLSIPGMPDSTSIQSITMNFPPDYSQVFNTHLTSTENSAKNWNITVHATIDPPAH